MKTALVVGFYDPVKAAIEGNFAAECANKSVIWIRQTGPHKGPKLDELASELYGCLSRNCLSILIIVGTARGNEWMIDQIRKMAEGAIARYPDAQIDIEETRNLGDPAFAVQKLSLFVDRASLITTERIRVRVGEQCRIVCVSMEGRTDIVDALLRSGFDPSTAALLTERKLVGARHSNLMDQIANMAASFDVLLYAWDGLRTLKPDVKNRYAKCYEAPTAAKVAQIFRRWILDE